MMEKSGDKCNRDKERNKHEGFIKEKSQSPFSADETTTSSCSDRNMVKSSPDVNSMTPAGRNGYCSSPTSGGGSSSSVVGCHSSKITKNIGVGANLNNTNITSNISSNVARQLRLGNLVSSSSSSTSSSSGHSTLNRALPSSHSPASIANALIPEMINQSQLGRSLPVALGSQGQSSTSPGLPTPLSTTKSEPPSSANKIVSQNLNGTLAVTSAPANDSELQLYRVLQRANLLNYFDVMIELGGDDVQQLCDAGEEEFLEIMALVGMASKPLHVRRLQKSLQEWMTQPHLFQLLGSHLSAAFGSQHSLTLPPSTSSSHENSSSQIQMPIRPIPFHSGNSQQPNFLNPTELMKNLQTKLCSLRGGSSETHGSNSSSPLGPNSVISLPNNNTTITNNNNLSQSINQCNMLSSQSGCNSIASVMTNGSPSLSMIPSMINLNGNSTRISPDQIIPSHFLEQRIRTRSEASSPASSTESPQLDSRTSLSPVPFLQDHEVQKLAETASQIISGLPSSMIEPRLSAKKKICAEFEAVIRIPENDPNRMDVVRKYAAIYGRNDCKRKVAKPLTLHELTVNEAASQLCSRLPALLTRRDELFPLARQVVKDAGLPYASLSNSNVSISLLPKTIKEVESSKLNPHNNNNNNGVVITSHYGGNNGKRMKLQDSRSTDSHELRSSFSNDNESNSEDSNYPNESASNFHQRGPVSRRITDRLFNLEKSDPSTSPNSIGALDMSSNCDEPNDLTIKNTNNKCNLSTSSNVRNSMHNNIKSEPVS